MDKGNTFFSPCVAFFRKRVFVSANFAIFAETLRFMVRYIVALFTLFLFLSVTSLQAQVYPVVNPEAHYMDVNGEESEDASMGVSAPLKATFSACPNDLGDYVARYEWKIWREGDEDDLLLHRFEEDIEYTFTESGTFQVQLYATFVQGRDTIVFPVEGEESPFIVSINESKLEFPNAFSPNGDGINDVLRAKEGYASIVSFEAAVFSRWGKKLYSWNDPSGGWDGRIGGRTVKDGVYFLVVNARGADGRKYNMRKTISVLTGYSDEERGGGGIDEE